MQLNLPILDAVKDSHNILIAGAGGGFDVFIGLPLYFTLRGMGKTVHLANYSFFDLPIASRISSVEVLINELLIGVRGALTLPLTSFAEGYLAQWFEQVCGETIPIWMFANTGAAPLAKGYARLTEHLGIDALILVDGGVDSLMRGDETAPGTLIEDALSLAAIKSLPIPIKLLACLGFGTEVEEGVNHHHALENIAALAALGGFLGSCALTPQMEAFQLFEAAARYVWEQPDHNKSHISTRIIPAVHGEFGDYHMYPGDKNVGVFISPLMSLYWFFDANVVIERSFIIEALVRTQTTREAFARYETLRRQYRLRPTYRLPY